MLPVYHDLTKLNFVRYFIIHNLADDESEIVRYAALLRGTESAWQALSYGLESVTTFAEIGGVYFNFVLWALAIFPAWTVVRHFGVDIAQPEAADDHGRIESTAGLKDKSNSGDEFVQPKQA